MSFTLILTGISALLSICSKLPGLTVLIPSKPFPVSRMRSVTLVAKCIAEFWLVLISKAPAPASAARIERLDLGIPAKVPATPGLYFNKRSAFPSALLSILRFNKETVAVPVAFIPNDDSPVGLRMCNLYSGVLVPIPTLCCANVECEA